MSTLSKEELLLKIEEWRMKAREGTLSIEETKEAMLYLRENRMEAASTSSSSRKPKVEVDAKGLLDDLMGS